MSAGDRPSTVTVIGLMGAGKTKVGRLAAAALGREFVDTDMLVEERTGRTVAEIFDSESEAAFRQLERQAVREAAAMRGVIVSVGGGAVLDPANAAALRAAGPVVWLHAAPEVLTERLRKSVVRGDRPLLHDADPATVLADLLAARGDAYAAAATATLRTDGLEVEQSAALLAEWIKDHT